MTLPSMKEAQTCRWRTGDGKPTLPECGGGGDQGLESLPEEALRRRSDRGQLQWRVGELAGPD